MERMEIDSGNELEITTEIISENNKCEDDSAFVPTTPSTCLSVPATDQVFSTTNILPVKYRGICAEMPTAKFAAGVKGRCIKMNDMWFSPHEFAKICGDENVNSWRQIKAGGVSIRNLINRGTLKVHIRSCPCTNCDEDSLVGPVLFRKDQNWDKSNIYLPNAVLPVKCRGISAEMHTAKFVSGSIGRCIKVGYSWYTPFNFFRATGGEDCTNRDWKGSIRYGDVDLRYMLNMGILPTRTSTDMDNKRPIPSMVDGLLPGQRKVLYACFKRNDKKEIKVAQLASYVAEISAYHHGEKSLMSTIVNLAQNFVGSNNVNLLQPIGQFGTRLIGGMDAASPDNIFTMLSPLARYLFPAHDDNLLTYLYDDNLRIEPEWYIPIVPMVLINGSEGIGTGWSTQESKIHNYSTREVCDIMLDMIDGKPPRHMVPSYKNFRGTLEELQTNRFACSGEVSVLDESTLEITELPIKTWTKTYKDQVLEPMLYGTEKTPALITDYEDYHTDTTIKFVVKMPAAKLTETEATGLHKIFKLQTSLNQMSTMVLYDSRGCTKKYEDVSDILGDFFELRLMYYAKRKKWLEGMLEAESTKLVNQAHFVLEVVNGEIVLVNRTTEALIQLFVERGYDSDPVKIWMEAQELQSGGGGAEEDPSDSDSQSQVSAATSTASGPDFKYLYTMHNICSDMVAELIKKRDQKVAELNAIKLKTPQDFWKEDLNSFLHKLGEVEEQERLDEVVAHAETKPTPTGRLVQPRIDPALKKIIPTKQEKYIYRTYLLNYAICLTLRRYF